MGMKGLIHEKNGFTLVELIAVLVVLGIVSAVVAPKFISIDDFENRSYFDEVATANRYAQKLAVASGCDVQVRMDAAGLLIRQRTNCDTTSGFSRDLILPGKDTAIIPPLGSTSIIPATTIIYSPLGTALDVSRNPTDFSFNVGGRSITVVGETGFVDMP